MQIYSYLVLPIPLIDICVRLKNKQKLANDTYTNMPHITTPPMSNYSNIFYYFILFGNYLHKMKNYRLPLMVIIFHLNIHCTRLKKVNNFDDGSSENK